MSARPQARFAEGPERPSPVAQLREVLPCASASGASTPVAALQSADVLACRASLRRNSRTFHAASLLLPARVRAPASVLYAFCRLADDAVDLPGRPLDAIERLHARLDRVYAGCPLPQAADRGMAAIVRSHALPRPLFDLLLEGLAWDASGRSYDRLEDLHDYAARVAGTVGALMALLMGVRDRHALARACDLGVAMQLSNIARDVGEDARMGRLYLPRQWLREAGMSPERWLAEPRFDPRLATVVRRLLDEAERLYIQAGAGVSQLPLDCRPGINGARVLYREIGRELLNRGGDSVNQRTVVPHGRQLAMLAAASLAPPRASPHLHTPWLRANEPLWAAVAALDAQSAEASRADRPESVDRWDFLVTLFDRLARQDLTAASGRASLPGGTR